jgi:adenosylcobinamide-GDP ribazoletransferase
MNVPAPIRGARAAFAFLTRIPLGGFPYRAEDWAWSAAHFPLVGAILGALLGGLHRLLLPLGGQLDAACVLGASMLLTGAFHEDGLADSSDALGGGYDRERVFAILKDSRIGAFGAAAIAVSVVARMAGLATLGREAAWALPIVACGARVGPVWQVALLPYVTPEGASRSRDVLGAGKVQAIVGTLWFALVCAIAVRAGVLSPVRAGALAAVITATAALSGWRYVRRVGGITGDFLGATEQIAEVALLGTLVWGRA